MDVVSWIVNGVGLFVSFLGAVLLFMGGPSELIGIGSLRWGSEEDIRKSEDPETKKTVAKLDEHRRLLKWGFALVGVGFLLQMVGWFTSFPSGSSPTAANVGSIWFYSDDGQFMLENHHKGRIGTFEITSEQIPRFEVGGQIGMTTSPASQGPGGILSRQLPVGTKLYLIRFHNPKNEFAVRLPDGTFVTAVYEPKVS